MQVQFINQLINQDTYLPIEAEASAVALVVTVLVPVVPPAELMVLVDESAVQMMGVAPIRPLHCSLQAAMTVPHHSR